MNIRMQKPADRLWVDEAGNKVPVTRLNEYEKVMEKNAFQIATRAKKLHEELKAFKTFFMSACDEAFNAFMIDNDGKKVTEKGNFTWFNFDRSIRVEIDIQEAIRFDDLTITLAKSKLDEFIGCNVQSSEEFVKDLILSAFENSTGKLDVKKVLGLKRHKTRIKDQRYHDAMD